MPPTDLEFEDYFRRVLRYLHGNGVSLARLWTILEEHVREGVKPTTPDTGTTSIAPSS